MINVELGGTIEVGAGASSEMLKGTALITAELQKEGLSLKLEFASSECQDEFVNHHCFTYEGTCGAFGNLITIQGGK